jgi:hypothetical protein
MEMEMIQTMEDPEDHLVDHPEYPIEDNHHTHLIMHLEEHCH